MTLPNLLAWAAQVAALVTAGLALAHLLNWRHPASRLRFLQALLLATLLLPLAAVRTPPPAPAVIGRAIRVDQDRLVLDWDRTTARMLAPNWTPWVAIALAAGVGLRLTLLAVRLAKLRALRRRGTPFSMPGTTAEIREVEELKSPATFGWRRPIVLLPATLAEPARHHALRHELEHIRAHDWPQSIAEEVIGSLLWFHPCVAWLRSRIRLAREQAVDAAVAGSGPERDRYIDSLLQSAGIPDLAALPVTQFARRRHLVERVAFLTEEPPMNQRRLVLTAVATIAAVIVTLAAVRAYYPIRVDAQTTEPLERTITVPRDAPVPEGDAVVEATLSATGDVIDARVLSGLDEHRRIALRTVLEMQFAAGEGTRRVVPVTIRFRKGDPPSGSLPRKAGTRTPPPPPPPPPPPVDQAELEGIDYTGLTPDQQSRASALLNFPAGTTFTEERLASLQTSLTAIDKSLRLRRAIRTVQGGKFALRLGVSALPELPSAIRVGGAVQAAQLLHSVPPVYPPLARQARIQGLVRFEATIDGTGAVTALTVVNGHPLLIQAAQEAAQQYRYRPTLLNGTPVTVRTTLDVNFILSPQAFLNYSPDLTPAQKQAAQTILAGVTSAALPSAQFAELRQALKQADPNLRLMRGDIHFASRKPRKALLVHAVQPTPPEPRVLPAIQARALIARPAPVYPAQARQRGLRGKVLFETLIDPTGRVAQADLLSGDPLLVQAARESVEQSQYQPAPSAIRTIVAVSF